MLAAKEFVGNELFLMVNSDNYYPVETLNGLRELERSGIALFDRDRLVAESNIPEDRVRKFAWPRWTYGDFWSGFMKNPPKRRFAHWDPLSMSV